MNLLLAAGFIQFDDPDRRWIIEIAGRWIDEGQMAVLADAQNGKIRRARFQPVGVIDANGIGIGCFTAKAVEFHHRNPAHQMIEQKFSLGMWRVFVSA